jgi:hypothetical protein
MTLPSLESQIRAVLSADAVATLVPSGLKTALATVSVWPLSYRASSPVSTFQMRAVRSLDAVTTC